MDAVGAHDGPLGRDSTDKHILSGGSEPLKLETEDARRAARRKLFYKEQQNNHRERQRDMKRAAAAAAPPATSAAQDGEGVDGGQAVHQAGEAGSAIGVAAEADVHVDHVGNDEHILSGGSEARILDTEDARRAEARKLSNQRRRRKCRDWQRANKKAAAAAAALAKSAAQNGAGVEGGQAMHQAGDAGGAIGVAAEADVHVDHVGSDKHILIGSEAPISGTEDARCAEARKLCNERRRQRKKRYLAAQRAAVIPTTASQPAAARATSAAQDAEGVDGGQVVHHADDAGNAIRLAAEADVSVNHVGVEGRPDTVGAGVGGEGEGRGRGRGGSRGRGGGQGAQQRPDTDDPGVGGEGRGRGGERGGKRGQGGGRGAQQRVDA